VGVFAGATNTPLACTIMAVELFDGGEHMILYALSCWIAYLTAGCSSIYLTQRLPTRLKFGDETCVFDQPVRISDISHPKQPSHPTQINAVTVT
jgi:hypothetical protein